MVRFCEHGAVRGARLPLRRGGRLPRPLDEMPYALAFADGVLAAGLADGTVYATGDGGESWERAQVEGDQPSRIMAFA